MQARTWWKRYSWTIGGTPTEPADDALSVASWCVKVWCRHGDSFNTQICLKNKGKSWVSSRFRRLHIQRIPRANCPFLPFCPNKRRSWWEWTIWWSFALALFLVLLLWGGVDDGKGEWDVNWYIWRKLYTNEGLKVSATIATIATIAKRVFLAKKIRSADVLTNKWFLWLLINRPCSVLFTVLNGGFIYGQI